MFFDNWFGILRILVVGTLSYLGLMIVLRVAGKRALSKMNAFDFVVTVAMGSALASATLTKDVVLLEGLTAFALLATLQYITSQIFMRFPRARRYIKAEPSLLMYKGVFYKHLMKKARMTEDEIMSALRSKGVRWENAQAVILETDGSLTVVPTYEGTSKTVYSGVQPQPYDQETVLGQDSKSDNSETGQNKGLKTIS